MNDPIDQMPLEERQRRAGEELAAGSPYEMVPRVTDMMAILRKWKVEIVIWPAHMGDDFTKPR